MADYPAWHNADGKWVSLGVLSAVEILLTTDSVQYNDLNFLKRFGGLTLGI